MSSLREGIRKLARGKNGFGFFCSAALCLKREGAGATAALIRTHREEKDFERRTRRSLRMDPQVFEAQRRDSEGSGLRFSICVPLYNTPAAFLQDMLDSVKGQSWENWELLLADGSDETYPEVREACEAAASADSRIRYRKLEANGGISENTNAALAMAKGNWIALMDHDDVLVPSALWETAQAVRETGAEFCYSDEAVFASPDPRRILEIHRKEEYDPKALLRSNYICHLAAFRKDLMEKAGGGFRKEYDGSQDHELFLRLTDAAETVAHVPKALYFWRSHGESVAADIGAKGYAVEAGQRAVKDFLANKGIRAEVSSNPICATIYDIKYL